MDDIDAIQRAKNLEQQAQDESANGNILVAAALRDEATRLRLDVEHKRRNRTST